MEPSLEKIFKSIVRNAVIREILLGNPPTGKNSEEYKVFKPFVEYQREAYSIEKTCLEDEGFQGGIPWVGDLKNASVLFLGPNPAFTYNQCCPRYHAKTDSWTICREQNGQAQQHVPINLQDVIKFFNNPLEEDCLIRIKGTSNPRLTVNVLKDEKITLKSGSVMFWKKLTYVILPKLFGITSSNDGHFSDDDVKYLLGKTVFTEIVPFQSMSGKNIKSIRARNVKAALKYCWDDFSKKILKNSKAKLWIIVGAMARDFLPRVCVVRNDEGEQAKRLKTGEIYHLNYGGQQRRLWVIPHPNARNSLFDICVNNTDKDMWKMFCKIVCEPK